MVPGAKELNAFLLEQLKPLPCVRSRAMMGGYLFYVEEKLIGGIYGPGFMLKRTEAVERALGPEALKTPYEGAKPMLLIENVQDRPRLCELVRLTYEALPAPAPKPPRRRAAK